MTTQSGTVTETRSTANRALLAKALEDSAFNLENKEYLELRRRVVEKGLLDRQYGYYAINILAALAALALGVAVIILVDQLWVRLITAAFMAAVFMQFNFIGHDAGHRQIFRSARYNDLVLILAGFVTGITPSWWLEKHNAHHRNPNQLELDDDINIPVYAFTKEDALRRRGLARFTVKYQAFLLYPLHSLTSFLLVGKGIGYLIRRQQLRYPVAEVVAVAAGLGLYFAVPFLFMPAWQAVVFIAAHRALAGLHMGLVFAPNHKGMPVLDAGMRLDYMRQQVLTSRNIHSIPLMDVAYGGLNRQIEHHLFPNMPRNRLKDARKVVKGFCEERGIAYHETGFWQSQREILGYMHEIGTPLRRRPAESQALNPAARRTPHAPSELNRHSSEAIR